ncbi:MAG: hypothetical protein U5K29_13160 [Acidimicrobiales bacterium]|nr:hypothetical protein [Acidimicrobiales bacterium]
MTDDTVDLPTPIVPGVARALSPLVRRIAVDLDGTAGPNTYLIGIDEIAVIDPGPDLDQHLDAIAGCGGDRIRWILTTGTGDQAGIKGLRARTDALVLTVDGIGPADADEMVGEDHTILGTEFRLVTMPAPGGEPRAMFLLEEERVLFGGDAVAALDEELLADRRLKRLRAVAPAEGQLIERL